MKKNKEYSISPSNITSLAWNTFHVQSSVSYLSPIYLQLDDNQNVPTHRFFFCDNCNKHADTHVKEIWKILFSIMFYYIKALCQTLKNAPGICEQ